MSMSIALLDCGPRLAITSRLCECLSFFSSLPSPYLFAYTYPVVLELSHEFLRDGDGLAARLTGTIKIEGAETFFKSFMFAKVDKDSGKLASLVERAVWGPVGGNAEYGVNS